MFNLYLIGGAPGSGKSAIAESLFKGFGDDTVIVAADDWFDKFNEGKFNPTKLPVAHEWCQDTVRAAIVARKGNVVVHNTLVDLGEKGAKPYLDMAREEGYTAHMMFAVNHHGSRSIHGVPNHVVAKMARTCGNTLVSAAMSGMEKGEYHTCGADNVSWAKYCVHCGVSL
ncbi:AAA family ATPase [bacterium]|nr:AAA family ATPase [bacterium]